MHSMLNSLSFFAIVSVFASTGITIFLYDAYLKKKLPPDTEGEKIPEFYVLVIFMTELYSQVSIEKFLDFEDAIFTIIGNVIGNIITFFLCYGILTLIGIDKENKFERCKKSFVGFLILLVLSAIFLGYANENGLI